MSYFFLVRFLVFSHLDLGPWDSHELIRFGSPKSVYLFPTCQARVSRFCQSCMPGLLNLLNRELQISVGTAGPQMSDRMPDRMPDRMSEYKSDKMPNRNPDRMSECIFQKECQIECQNMCQVECQIECQNMCQIEYQLVGMKEFMYVSPCSLGRSK